MFNFLSHLTTARKPKIQIQKPEEEELPAEDISLVVQKYARLVSEEPDPNAGRIQEIKEEIKKGTYLKREMVRESATRLTMRFLKKDR